MLRNKKVTTLKLQRVESVEDEKVANILIK